MSRPSPTEEDIFKKYYRPQYYSNFSVSFQLYSSHHHHDHMERGEGKRHYHVQQPCTFRQYST